VPINRGAVPMYVSLIELASKKRSCFFQHSSYNTRFVSYSLIMFISSLILYNVPSLAFVNP
jgi:hypothetical protein